MELHNHIILCYLSRFIYFISQSLITLINFYDDYLLPLMNGVCGLCQSCVSCHCGSDDCIEMLKCFNGFYSNLIKQIFQNPLHRRRRLFDDFLNDQYRKGNRVLQELNHELMTIIPKCKNNPGKMEIAHSVFLTFRNTYYINDYMNYLIVELLECLNYPFNCPHFNFYFDQFNNIFNDSFIMLLVSDSHNQEIELLVKFIFEMRSDPMFEDKFNMLITNRDIQEAIGIKLRNYMKEEAIKEGDDALLDQITSITLSYKTPINIERTINRAYNNKALEAVFANGFKSVIDEMNEHLNYLTNSTSELESALDDIEPMPYSQNRDNELFCFI